MLRPVTASSRKLFYESYQELELNLEQPGRRATPNSSAIAHLTVRIPGNVAITLTVTGPIVNVPLPLDEDWPYQSDVLSCG